MKIKLLKNHLASKKGDTFEARNASYSNGELIFRDERTNILFHIPVNKIEVVKEVNHSK